MEIALSILRNAIMIGILIVGLGGICVFVGSTLARAAETDEPHH